MRPGDILALQLAGGTLGLIQILQIDRLGPVVCVLDFEGTAVPTTSRLERIKVLQDPRQLTGDVVGRVIGFTGEGLEAVTNVPPKLTKRYVDLSPDEWLNLPVEEMLTTSTLGPPWTPRQLPDVVYYGGHLVPPEGDETGVFALFQKKARDALEKRRRRKAITAAERRTILAKLPTLPRGAPADRMCGTVIDDDGVIVVASAQAIALRYARTNFDYTFPLGLLQAINAQALAAWQGNVEGDVRVDIRVESRMPRTMRVCGSITFGETDSLLLLPYSAFTYAADNLAGIPDEGDRANHVRFPAPVPGTYVCGVSRPKSDTAFEVVLAPAPPSKLRAIVNFDEI